MTIKPKTPKFRQENAKNRIYIEFKPDFIRNLSHIGKSRSSLASKPLALHVHPRTMEICYLHQGQQVFEVKGKSYNMCGGDIFITFPGEKHGSGEYPLEKSELYWIGLDLKTPAVGFLNYSEPESEKLRYDLQHVKTRFFKGGSRFKHHMEKIFLLFANNHKLKRILMRNYITDLILSVLRYEQEQTKSGVSAPIRNIMDVIQHSLPEVLPLQALADQACLSLSRFKARFKQEAGISPHEYMLRKKVEAAKILISTGKYDIVHIANRLNFSTSQYFATVFKRFTGITPSMYMMRSKA